MMHQMFSIGERSELQAGQFSTRTLWLRSNAVVIAALYGFVLSCLNKQGLPWNRRRCSKTFIYLSAFIVPSKTCKLPIPYALIHPHTIRDAGFWTECWWHAWRFPSPLSRRTRRPWFPTWISNLDSDHFSTLKQSILNESWPTGHYGASGPCSHMASFTLHLHLCIWQTFLYKQHCILSYSFYILSALLSLGIEPMILAC